MKFTDKVVVVTGAGTDPDQEVIGFGHQIANDLYYQGATVAIIGTSISRLRDATFRITGSHNPSEEFSYHSCDVADEELVEQVFDYIRETHGAVYGLVNNAAVNIINPLAELELSEMRRVLDVNLLGPMLCAKHAIRQMLETGRGSIVNVSSIAAKKRSTWAEMPAYNTSKRGLEAVSDSISRDYGLLGIRSNVVRPGFARTPFTSLHFAENPALEHSLSARQPLGGLVTPEQIAGGVLYFLDPACPDNGEILEISNGHIAG